MHTILILNALRAGQLRWVANQEWEKDVGREGQEERQGCSPAGHLLGCRNFAWQWTKFCGKYSQCFCFCAESFSCFFQIVILLSKFAALQADTDYKNFTAYLWQLLLSLLQGAWHLSTCERRNRTRSTRSVDPDRIDINCERLRYFRFGHLPDYFVLCLRIGARQRPMANAKVGADSGWVWQAEQ